MCAGVLTEKERATVEGRRREIFGIRGEKEGLSFAIFTIHVYSCTTCIFKETNTSN